MTTRKSLVASRQSPLRQAYREDKGKAISVKRARTVQGPKSDAFHGAVAMPGYPKVRWEYGIDAKIGGFDDLPNPGHLLCAALAGCIDSTVRMLADHLGVGIEHLEVEVTGDVDVRGCLAMDRSVRPGFRKMHCDIQLEVDPDANARTTDLLLKQTEQLCVTLDTLRNGIPITVSPNIQRASATA